MQKMSRTKKPQRASHTSEPAPDVVLAMQYVASKLGDAARAAIPTGVYHIDQTVHLKGTLSKATDTEVATSANPDYVGLVAYLLSLLPERRRFSVVDNLADEYQQSGQFASVDEQLTVATQELLKALRRPVTQARRGAVTGAIAATVVG